jgi:coproporphyrinogen III oxidase-like Fe-S oxidoreductase
VTSADEVKRAELPFEFMLNSLRLREGFALQDFLDRTGLPLSAIERGMTEAVSKGLMDRDAQRAWPTARGFDFLSDLQGLFLPD